MAVLRRPEGGCRTRSSERYSGTSVRTPSRSGRVADRFMDEQGSIAALRILAPVGPSRERPGPHGTREDHLRERLQAVLRPGAGDPAALGPHAVDPLAGVP